MMTNENENINVDDKTVARLIKRIIIEETRNIKSGEKSDREMVEKIKDMIEEEVKCY
jgi:hypothetical protein